MKTTRQHTSGPWTWSLDLDHSRQEIWRTHGSPSCIDYIASVTMPEDARLIAAAPDLLAALKEVTEMLLSINVGYAGGDPVMNAHAAIAKATPPAN